MIKKIKLVNFKRFRKLSVDLDKKTNILIGDNESGKSTVLTAIDLVLSGSRSKVESIGLENIFNVDVVHEFLDSDRKLENLPQVFIELFLDDQDDPELNGKINSDDLLSDGLRFICEPNDSLSKEINEILRQPSPNFPFEYYLINFKTFSGESYTGYRKYLRHVIIDNTQINNEYATREYVKTLYEGNVNDAEKNKHQNEYRKYKEHFKEHILSDVNARLESYSFAIRSNSKSCLETDLTIAEDNITIENKGKGKQCFIKTDFALKKYRDRELDVVLLEEPENHLSHTNMKKLINKISESNSAQLFISTHNSLISSRLDLRKSILLNSNSSEPLLLKNLPDDTAKYFMKAPNHNVLEFILSPKVILVEGDAEYILIDEFYKKITKEKMEDSGVHIISVGGTSFKRYLDLSKILKIKTAVIRDNDHDYQANCVDNYKNFKDGCIKIFSDLDNNRYTFEIAIYQNNVKICNDLFARDRKTLSVEEYMLKNKTDAAFELLSKKVEELIPPNYITEAIEWIRK